MGEKYLKGDNAKDALGMFFGDLYEVEMDDHITDAAFGKNGMTYTFGGDVEPGMGVEGGLEVNITKRGDIIVNGEELASAEAMDKIIDHIESESANESIKESKKRRFTVKEVRMWMKKLEENRYKKVYNSDARRVAWMVNNEGVELSEMPKSMSKKWTKAQYGRERYLATEFLKSKSEQMNESKLRGIIRGIIKEQLNEAKFKKIILPNDKKSQTITSKIIRKMNLRYQKDYNMLAHGSGPLKAKGGNQVITILPKHYNKFIELAMKNKLNPRG